MNFDPRFSKCPIFIVRGFIVCQLHPSDYPLFLRGPRELPSRSEHSIEQELPSTVNDLLRAEISPTILWRREGFPRVIGGGALNFYESELSKEDISSELKEFI